MERIEKGPSGWGRLARSWSLGLALSVAAVAGTTSIMLVADQALAQARQISFDEARRIALEQVPGARVESVELKHRSQPLMYEVELRDPRGIEYEVWIDATTGAVLRIEEDD